MKKFFFAPILAILLPLITLNAQGDTNPMVLMKTNLGDIEIELFPDKAPVTVENFLNYTQSGFYNGTIFHRVIPGFVVQGGGFEPGMNQKQTQTAITNESDNGLANHRGTLSMARLPDPHSATSQFFINLQDNPHLDHGGGSQWGYAVFAKVIKGMDVVDQMTKGATTTKGHFSDVPATDIVIEEASVIGQDTQPGSEHN